MEIQTTSTFEQLLQAETLNVNKKKAYYQRYDVNQLRAFHKQAMIKQQIGGNFSNYFMKIIVFSQLYRSKLATLVEIACTI